MHHYINKFFVTRKYHDGACQAYEDEIKHLNRKVYELEQQLLAFRCRVAPIRCALNDAMSYFDEIARQSNGK